MTPASTSDPAHIEQARAIADAQAQLQLGVHWAGNAPLAAAFRAFDRDNPQVYDELRRLAMSWRHAGRKHLGVKMLWEVMRWNLSIQSKTGEPFKLNNNYTSFYARKLMAHEAYLAEIFDTRGRTVRCECDRCHAAS